MSENREELAKRLVAELLTELQAEEIKRNPPDLLEDQRLPVGTRIRVTTIIDNHRGYIPLVGAEGVVIDGDNNRYIWVKFEIPEEGLLAADGWTFIYDEERLTIITGFLPGEIERI